MIKQLTALLLSTSLITDVALANIPARSIGAVGSSTGLTTDTNTMVSNIGLTTQPDMASNPSHEYMNTRDNMSSNRRYSRRNEPTVGSGYGTEGQYHGNARVGQYDTRSNNGLNTGVDANSAPYNTGLSPLNSRRNAGLNTGLTPGAPRLSPEANVGTNTSPLR